MYDELYGTGLSSEDSLLFLDSNFLPFTSDLEVLSAKAPLNPPQCVSKRLLEPRVPTLSAPVSSETHWYLPQPLSATGHQKSPWEEELGGTQECSREGAAKRSRKGRARQKKTHVQVKSKVVLLLPWKRSLCQILGPSPH